MKTRLQVGDLELDLLTRTAQRAGSAIDLQPREFRLLEYLMRHASQVVTRTMLLESVWEYHFDPQTNVIDVHISRLRAKIDKGFDTALLLDLRARLDRLEIPGAPFTKATGLPRIGAHWARPEIVVQVAFIEWTVHGKLRHPRLLGVRFDKAPHDVTREDRQDG